MENGGVSFSHGLGSRFDTILFGRCFQGSTENIPFRQGQEFVLVALEV